MIDFYRHRAVGYCLTVCATMLFAIACTSKSEPALQAAQVQEEELEPISVTVFTDQVELFMEYPRLIIGEESRFLAHVTVMKNGDPVRSGKLSLELTSSSGKAHSFKADKPKRDGLFIPVGVFAEVGEYKAKIVVDSDQVKQTIPLAPLVVHRDLQNARATAEAEASDEPSDVVSFLLEAQWKINMLMEVVGRRSLTERLQVPGEIEAINHAIAVVSTPLGGLLLPPDSGHLPHIGDQVEKGQVLGYLEPPLTTSDVAQLVANRAAQDSLEMELMLRDFDLQNKVIEVQQSALQAEARLKFARQTLSRIEMLQEKGLSTVAELESALQSVELSQQEFNGAKILQGSLAQAGAKLKDLQARSAENASPHVAHAGVRLPLVAAISGEIVNVNHVEGEFVEGQEEVFRVLDLSHVWIAAHVSEFDLAAIVDTPGALLKFAAYPERTFDMLGGMGGRLVSVGREVDSISRTIELHYEAPNPDGLFRAGMFVDVYLETKRAVDAVAIPEQAIVMDNGQPVAFVLLDGENFQKRDLELGIRDGRFVEVLSGLQEGERVATKGAYLIKLAAASPASFGAGHVH